jgi:hypothetical protein
MAAGALEIEKSLCRYLLALAGVQRLAGDRVSPWKSSQGTQSPKLTYKLVSGERVEALSGPVGMAKPVYRLSCWGNTMEEARALALVVRGNRDAPALDGFRGWMGGREAGHFVQCARVRDASDDPEEPYAGDEQGEPCVGLDVQLFYEEKEAG